MTNLLILIALVGLGVMFLQSRQEITPQKRLQSLTARWQRRAGSAQLKSQSGADALKPRRLTREQHDSDIPILDQLLKRLPRLKGLRQKLQRTGRDIKVSQYLLAVALSCAIWSLVIITMANLKPIVAIFAGILIGLWFPRFVINKMIARRQKKFIIQFPDGLDLMVRSLRAGLPLHEAFETIITQIPGPVAVTFASIGEQMQLGKPIEEALQNQADHLDIEEFRFFVTAMAIQKETGGNLTETLENLGDVLRKRKQVKLKIKAMSSEARASAIIIGSLPFIMFGVLMKMAPDYMALLFEDPRGTMMLVVGLFFIALGAGVMNKMVKFEI